MSLKRRIRLAACTGFILGALMGSAMAGKEDPMTTALIDAVTAGDADKVAAGLAGGAPLEQRDAARRTALMIATRKDYVAIARRLIEAGADVNAKDNIRDTPFLYAGAEGRDEILKLILASGRAKLDDTNRYGGTALIPAAHHGHPETVRILLEAGVEVNHINDLGWTALVEAVILGDGGPVYREIVGLLIDAGADPRIGDKDGVTPLEHAQRLRHDEIASLIEAAPEREAPKKKGPRKK